MICVKPPELLSGCLTVQLLFGLDPEQSCTLWVGLAACLAERRQISLSGLCRVWTHISGACLLPSAFKLVGRGRSITLRTVAMTNTDWCVISGSSALLSSLSRSSLQALALAERLKMPLVYGPSRYRKPNMSWSKQGKKKVKTIKPAHTSQSFKVLTPHHDGLRQAVIWGAHGAQGSSEEPPLRGGKQGRGQGQPVQLWVGPLPEGPVDQWPLSLKSLLLTRFCRKYKDERSCGIFCCWHGTWSEKNRL